MFGGSSARCRSDFVVQRSGDIESGEIVYRGPVEEQAMADALIAAGAQA